MNQWLEKIPNSLKNKYVLTLIVYLIYLTFFDSNNLGNQWQLYLQSKKLDKEKSFYTQELEKLYREKEELFSDMAHIEKFARENYFMKRSDEQIYIIEEQ